MFTKATRRIPTDGVAVFDAPHRRSPVVTVMAWPMIVRRKHRGSGGFGEAERFGCAWVWDTAMPNYFPQNLEECTGRSMAAARGCRRIVAVRQNVGARLQPPGMYSRCGCEWPLASRSRSTTNLDPGREAGSTVRAAPTRAGATNRGHVVDAIGARPCNFGLGGPRTTGRPLNPTSSLRSAVAGHRAARLRQAASRA
jgi:hypothetical protein